MTNDPRLSRRYADLLGDHADPDLAGMIADLDAAFETIRPPAGMITTKPWLTQANSSHEVLHLPTQNDLADFSPQRNGHMENQQTISVVSWQQRAFPVLVALLLVAIAAILFLGPLHARFAPGVSTRPIPTSIIGTEPPQNVGKFGPTIDLTSLKAVTIPVVFAYGSTSCDSQPNQPLWGSFSYTDQRTGVVSNVIKVKVGTPITWIGRSHTPESIHSGTLGQDTTDFLAPVLNQGQSFEWTPLKPGNYPYYSSFHPAMVGEIIAVP